MRKLASLIAVLLAAAFHVGIMAQSQPFILVPDPGLPALAHSWVSWGDFDRDGDLDVAICGDSALIPKTYVFRNDNGTFINSGFTLPQITNGSIEWGDMDNNGWLDLLVTGNDEQGNTKAYIVTNSGGTIPVSSISLAVAVSNGQARWGDYDNDGSLDILMAGNYTSRILHNNGNSSFSEISAPLTAVANASCNWVDYNNDGQSDVFLCGHVDLGDVSKLYRNEHGQFTEVNLQPSGILGMSYGSARWADLDRDGDMDLLISGVDTLFGYVLVYKNNGSDVFQKIDNYTFNLFSTSMDIADYNNDGLPDIIICGKLHSCGGSAITLLYENTGNMMFNNVYTDIAGIAGGGAAFADFNGDGFTDLLVSGSDSYGETATRLYRNASGSPQYSVNTAPQQPGNLSVQQSGANVTIRWNRAVDAETPADALMYNIFIGSDSDTIDVFSPMSDLGTGMRRISCSGNTGQDTSWTVFGLPQGTYFWSVQTIDNGFMPSSFAPVQSFTFTPTGISHPPAREAVVYPNPCKDLLRFSPTLPGNSIVDVYDSRGSLVLSTMYADGMNVSTLLPGLYFAKARFGDQATSATFMKL